MLGRKHWGSAPTYWIDIVKNLGAQVRYLELYCVKMEKSQDYDPNDILLGMPLLEKLKCVNLSNYFRFKLSKEKIFLPQLK
jgi:hypothetical protein